MNLYENIGISFDGNYIKQGTYEEKCKLSKKSNISNISLKIKTIEDINLKKVYDIYKKNIIFTLPTINYDLSNLKEVEQTLLKLLPYNINEVIISAFNFSVSKYEWSTDEEQRKQVELMADALALLASKKVVISIENNKVKEDGYFGQDMSQISDLIVYSRKILIEKYNFTEKNANKYIKLCLNINNITKKDLDDWLNVFSENISIIKINSSATYEKILNIIFDKIKNNELNTLILVNEKKDLEEVEKNIITLNNIVNVYSKNNGIEIKKEIKVKPKKNINYSNAIIIVMIILTIIIAILMVYAKFK